MRRATRPAICRTSTRPSGVAMLIGAVANNAEQASSIGVFAGLGIAAIGGSMVPPEIFPEPMATISWFTPHRWALDGFRELIIGGDVVAILPQLGVHLALHDDVGDVLPGRGDVHRAAHHVRKRGTAFCQCPFNRCEAIARLLTGRLGHFPGFGIRAYRPGYHYPVAIHHRTRVAGEFLEAYKCEEMVAHGINVKETIACNWKVVIDNFIERVAAAAPRDNFRLLDRELQFPEYRWLEQ